MHSVKDRKYYLWVVSKFLHKSKMADVAAVMKIEKLRYVAILQF